MNRVFNCKICGAPLDVIDTKKICQCEYCGTKQTVPTLDNEKIANLYNRGNELMRNYQFDDANNKFEEVLSYVNDDPDVYWSLLLCKFGVTYEKDPYTGKNIPTIHRTQDNSIYNEEDYKLTINYSNPEQKAYYETQAKIIENIQIKYESIVKKEKLFDIFICYKQTDDNTKNDTIDYQIAYDLYNNLTKEGYKVFFSHVTLEDKIGEEYEPYIYAALKSSKVLLAIGTSKELYNAVWVKNEWRRFLFMMRNSHSKKLIPICTNSSVLPPEFSRLQAIEMNNNIVWKEDLIRGLKKIFITNSNDTNVSNEIKSNNVSTNSLLERAFLFLEDGNWQNADSYLDKALDIDPKNAEAYLGKLMVELQVKTRKQLADCAEPFDNKGNFTKIIRFGDEKIKNEICSYINAINERNKETAFIKIYNNAVDNMNAANTEEAFKDIAKQFQSISGYKHADVLANDCLKKAEICRKNDIYENAKSFMRGESINFYESAIKGFEQILDWEDSSEQINLCKKKIEEIKKQEEIHRIESEEASKKRKKTIAILTPIVCICILLVIILDTLIIPNIRYKSAIDMINNGNYIDAYNILISLDDYKDSKDKSSSIYFQYIKEKMLVANVGDTIKFGLYEQDNNISNGKEDIEWQVLAKKDNKILVISDKGLDNKQYNNENPAITWENCSLRSWLNETFINEAFNEEELKLIANTYVSADTNPKCDVEPGNDTEDRIFLLSIIEAQKYLGSLEDRKCIPTDYAIANGARVSNNFAKNGKNTCNWWLRSTGFNQLYSAYIGTDGSILYSGSNAYLCSECVRPALWIDLDY